MRRSRAPLSVWLARRSFLAIGLPFRMCGGEGVELHARLKDPRYRRGMARERAGSAPRCRLAAPARSRQGPAGRRGRIRRPPLVAAGQVDKGAVVASLQAPAGRPRPNAKLLRCRRCGKSGGAAEKVALNRFIAAAPRPPASPIAARFPHPGISPPTRGNHAARSASRRRHRNRPPAPSPRRRPSRRR